MFRMQCEGTRKDGGQCESMVNYNGWNLDDAGGIYCRHHINQGYFRPTSNEQQPEPVKLSDIVKYTPHFFGLIIFFGISFIVEPAFAVGCLLIPFALLVMGILAS